MAREIDCRKPIFIKRGGFDGKWMGCFFSEIQHSEQNNFVGIITKKGEAIASDSGFVFVGYLLDDMPLIDQVIHDLETKVRIYHPTLFQSDN